MRQQLSEDASIVCRCRKHLVGVEVSQAQDPENPSFVTILVP